MQFMVMVNGAQQGPFSVEQLKGMPPATLVWCQGMPAWAAASTVPTLAALFAPAGPPAGFAPPPAGFGAPQAQPPGQYGQPGGIAPGGVFSTLGSTRASVDSNYPRPGTQIVQIVRLKGSKGLNAENFIIEQRVCHVIDEGRTDPCAAINQPHFAGEDVGHVMSAKFQSFAGNVKSAVASLVGMPADAWDNLPDRDAKWLDLMRKVTADGTTVDPATNQPLAAQPLSNMFFEMYAHTIPTRKGGHFTKVVYRRRVPAADVKNLITQRDPSGNTIARLFPNGVIDRIIAAETAQGIVASPMSAQPPQPQWGAPAPQPAPAAPAGPAFPPAPAAPAGPVWGAQPGAPAAPPVQPQAQPAFAPAPGPFPGAAPPRGPFG